MAPAKPALIGASRAARFGKIEPARLCVRVLPVAIWPIAVAAATATASRPEALLPLLLRAFIRSERADLEKRRAR